jgi:hypothetical protein
MFAFFQHYPLRTINFIKSFDGTAGDGAAGAISLEYDTQPNSLLKINEFVADIYYRVTTPFVVSGGALADTHIEMGVEVDDTDQILDITTGDLATMNATGADGTRISPTSYKKASANNRQIIAYVVNDLGGPNHIIEGELEITIVIGSHDTFKILS